MTSQNNTQTKKERHSFNDQWQQGWNGWQNWTNTKDWQTMFERMTDNTLAQRFSEKNSEAANKANQLAFQGAQTLAQRTAERMQETGKRSWECMQDACCSKTAADLQECQNELLTCTVQNYCKHTNEVAELAAKTTLQVLDIWTKRTTDAFAELAGSK